MCISGDVTSRSYGASSMELQRRSIDISSLRDEGNPSNTFTRQRSSDMAQKEGIMKSLPICPTLRYYPARGWRPRWSSA